MKVLRTIVLLFFLIVSGVFGFYEYGLYRSRDEIAPVITADSDEIVVSVQDDTSAYVQGMKAMDNKDGDVTDSIVETAKSYFITGRTFRVNYVAFDSHNNVGTYSRMATFSDYTSPTFAIHAPLRFAGGNANTDLTGTITASDVCDGDITSQIKVLSNNMGYYYDSPESSTYQTTLQVMNSFGDIQELTVTVSMETSANYYKSSPALSEYLVYTGVNEGIDFSQYVMGIWSGGSSTPFENQMTYERGDVQIDASRVDYGTPGTYTVSFMLVKNGEVIGTTEMYVVVRG